MMVIMKAPFSRIKRMMLIILKNGKLSGRENLGRNYGKNSSCWLLLKNCMIENWIFVIAMMLNTLQETDRIMEHRVQASFGELGTMIGDALRKVSKKKSQKY